MWDHDENKGKEITDLEVELEDEADENENVVELIDEDGQSVRFEHLMTLTYEAEQYVVLTATEDNPDMDEDEVFILRIAKDEQDEDCYVTVDDEALMEKVFARFMEILEHETEEDGAE